MSPEVRALFPITQRSIYFNHAAVSPPPITTIRAVEAQLRDVHENGSTNFRSWLAVKEDARKLLANLFETLPMRFRLSQTDSTGAQVTTSSPSAESFLPTYTRGFAYATCLASK
jgi:selenocysteine lyase/cysteine desulfurase